MNTSNHVRVEFHCHTVFSKDSLIPPEKLIVTAQKKQLDRVIVTDHNTIRGAQATQVLAPEMIIIGEEIMTTQGELLAAFVQEEIPSGLTPTKAIARLREQGAFISISHPFDRMRSGHWQTTDLLNILPLIDAIEIFNARCMWPGFNQQAAEFACRHHLAGTVGSDAHAAFEIGRATLLLENFSTAETLRTALPQSLPNVRLSAPWVHFTSRYAVWRKKRQPP